MTAQTILPANSVVDSGFNVANSLRFNSADSAHLDLTDPPGNNYYGQFTFSFWVKRCKLASEQYMVQSSAGNTTSFGGISFNSSDQLVVQLYDSTDNLALSMITTRVFRDISAWYHIMIAFDLSDGTTADRIKIYVNGTRETSFATSTIPGSGFGSAMFINATDPLYIGRGRNTGGTTVYSDFYLAQFLCVTADSGDTDGLNADAELIPTQVGEFDEDSGIWKPIEIDTAVLGASLDMSDNLGTNGFFLDFADSSNLGNDVNGGTDWDENNITAADQSTDTCTNNFATLASGLYTSGATFSQGNLQYQAPGSNPVFGSLTTIGVDNGKWYAEVKYTAGSNHYLVLGIADEVFAGLSDLGTNTNTDLGKVGASLSTQAAAQNSTVAYVVNTGKIRNNNANGDYGSGGGDGDIIQIALDRDNRKVYFGINGTYEASGDPGAGSNGFDLSSLVTGDTYFIGVTNDTGASETIAEFNFGSPSYAISSSNADANGHGNFEFAVPSGFFALCTKNLAEHG